MKDKKIRILCAVTALISLLAVVPIMFDFFIYQSSDMFGREYWYNVLGYGVFTDTEQPINIVVGVFGLLGLLWDLAFGAYAIIDGRYKDLLWRIIRYGYFYGIAMGLINFAFIVSYLCYFECCAGSVIFLILVAAVIALKFVLIFTRNEETRNLSANGTREKEEEIQ